MIVKSRLTITPHELILNGEKIVLEDYSLNYQYRKLIGNYPKFFKMDSICKLGFIASEILLKDIPPSKKENSAIILFNKNGSLITDRNYQQTINSIDNYFPSPALFVYTLANIVTGEIAIRHKMFGESSFYILDEINEMEMDSIVESTFLTSSPSFILTGWIDYENKNDYLANIKIVTNK